MGPKSHSQRMVTLQAHVYAVDATGAHVCTDARAGPTPSAPECRPTHELWRVAGIALCLRLQGAGASGPSRWTLGRVPGRMPYSPSDKEDPTGPSGAGKEAGEGG